MSKKEQEQSGLLQTGFSEDKLFNVSWHVKLLTIIYGSLIVSYILLKLFLK